MSKKSNKSDLICKWTGCISHAQSVKFETPEDLSRHVDECHLEPSAEDDLFFCLWEGCKVYNKPSYSFGWLKRHTKEKHTKERPNKCLMNGCNMAFNSVDALQRHMMRHFQRTPPPAKAVQSNARTLDGTPPLITRGRVLEGLDEGTSSDVGSLSPSSSHLKSSTRGRRRYSLKIKIPRHTLYSSAHSPGDPVAFNGAHFHGEVLDRRTMEVIKQTTNVLSLSDSHTSQPTTCITMTAQVVGKRRVEGQKAEVLVRWKPRLTPDSWVSLDMYKEKKTISLHELSPTQLSSIAGSCFGCHSDVKRKNKRKPG